MVPPDNAGFPPVLLSLRARVFNTQTLAHISDSLVRVSRRAVYSHFVYIVLFQIPKVGQTMLLSLPHVATQDSTSTCGFDKRKTHVDADACAHTNLGRRRKHIQTNTGRKPFPFNDFRYFLTLFSEFFSSFVHTTCSLSVSRQYLAFDGIYHQLRAAVPSNSTL